MFINNESDNMRDHDSTEQDLKTDIVVDNESFVGKMIYKNNASHDIGIIIDVHMACANVNKYNLPSAFTTICYERNGNMVEFCTYENLRISLNHLHNYVIQDYKDMKWETIPYMSVLRYMSNLPEYKGLPNCKEASKDDAAYYAGEYRAHILKAGNLMLDSRFYDIFKNRLEKKNIIDTIGLPDIKKSPKITTIMKADLIFILVRYFTAPELYDMIQEFENLYSVKIGDIVSYNDINKNTKKIETKKGIVVNDDKDHNYVKISTNEGILRYPKVSLTKINQPFGNIFEFLNQETYLDCSDNK